MDPYDFEAARERVKRKLVFDEQEQAEQATRSSSFSKHLKANFDTYLKDFPVLANNSTTPGWEVLLHFDLNRVLNIFPEKHRENIKSLYKKMERLIRAHYVRTNDFIRDMAKKENIEVDDFFISSNENIVAIRRMYPLDKDTAMLNEYLALQISDDDMGALYSYCSTFISLILAVKVDKLPYLAKKIVESTHVACFKPFYNDFNIAFFEEAVSATPSLKVMQYVEQMASEDVEMFDLKGESYFTLEGHLLLLCESAPSRGANSAGNKFNVLYISDASEQILREYFNKFMRQKFPELFKGLSEMMFFNVTEVRDVPRIDCLLPLPSLKNKVVVSVNLSRMTLVCYKKGDKQSLVPQVQMYTNCIFAQRK